MYFHEEGQGGDLEINHWLGMHGADLVSSNLAHTQDSAMIRAASDHLPVVLCIPQASVFKVAPPWSATSTAGNGRGRVQFVAFPRDKLYTWLNTIIQQHGNDIQACDADIIALTSEVPGQQALSQMHDNVNDLLHDALQLAQNLLPCTSAGDSACEGGLQYKPRRYYLPRTWNKRFKVHVERANLCRHLIKTLLNCKQSNVVYIDSCRGKLCWKPRAGLQR